MTISTPEQQQVGGGLWDRFTAPTESVRRPFRRWRRGRPFFAGLSVALAGADIYYWPHSSLGKQLSMGLPGISSVFISIFLVIFAVTIWFFPSYRVFSGIASIMLALLALVATNLGGFLLGTLLGMFGGAFAVAWTPRTDYTAETRRQRQQRLGTAEFAAGEAGAEAAAAAPTAGADTERIENADASAVPAWGAAWATPDETAASAADTPAAEAPEIPRQADGADKAAGDKAGKAEVNDSAEAADADDATDITDITDAAEEAANIAIIEQAARSDETAPVNPEPSVKED